jgi:hypothetical protein
MFKLRMRIAWPRVEAMKDSWRPTIIQVYPLAMDIFRELHCLSVVSIILVEVGQRDTEKRLRSNGHAASDK